MRNASKAACIAGAALAVFALWVTTRGWVAFEAPGALAPGPDEVADEAASRAPGRSVREPAAAATKDAEPGHGALWAEVAPVLEGRVVSAEGGLPLAGLRVGLALEGAPAPASRATDAEGRFRLGLAQEARLVMAWVAAGERSVSHAERVDLELVPGRPRELVLRVPGGTRIPGRVVDSFDRPVAGAQVVAWLENEPSEEPDRVVGVDERGLFALEHMGGDCLLEPRAPGWITADVLRGRCGSEPLEGLVLRMARPGALRVRVLDDVGAPVEHALVSATREGALDWLHDTKLRLVPVSRSGPGRPFTDSKGEVLFEDLPSLPHQIRVWCTGFDMAQVGAHPGEGATVRVTLAPSIGPRGIVLDPEGEPAAHARVILGNGTDQKEILADELGRFDFQDAVLRPESWIAAHEPGAAPFVQEPVRATDFPLQIRLVRGLSIEGVLLDADGEPLSNAVLRIAGERRVSAAAPSAVDPPPTWEESVLGLDFALTDERGRFGFHWLHEGRFELAHLHWRDDVPRRTVWDVWSGEVGLRLRLPQDPPEEVLLEGLVVEAGSGASVDGARVSVTSGDLRRDVGEGAEWRAAFVWGGPRTIALSFEAEGHLGVRRHVRVEAAGRYRLDVELVPSRSLAVVVLGAGGAPIAGALLCAFDGAGGALHTGRLGVTDAEGRANLEGLPAGRVVVQVRDPEAPGGATELFDLDLTDPEPVRVLRLGQER